MRWVLLMYQPMKSSASEKLSRLASQPPASRL
ncbi:Uncharacterised protein [Bordetella pertussis]|nr:Uncharacterised protein [Bordetella pertussis]